jgi:heptaprenyl diphosphate synthase
MQSYADRTATVQTTEKTLWLLLAVALNTLELFIPRMPILPWLKPGLANCITIVWIIRYGTADALLYTLLRVWISSFYFGFSLITMSLAVSGGASATLAMGLAWQLLGRKGRLGTLGLGIIGAVFHNAGQLLAVYFLLTRNGVVFYQIPFMGGAALLFGGCIGAIVPTLWRILVPDETHGVRREMAVSGQTPQSRTPSTALLQSRQYPPRGFSTILNIAILAGSISLVAVHDLVMLGSIAASTTLLCFFALGRKPSVVVYPLRMWALFLFVGLVYLFFSYGTRVAFIPFVTYEGLQDTAAQCLRLWTWLEAGLLLQKLRCNLLLFAVLKRIFPLHGDTLLAGVLALEYFPPVVAFVKSKDARGGIAWRRPAAALSEFTGRVQQYITGLLET